MGISRPRPLWWDREVDEQSGLPLRSDVRDAAHRIWPWIRSKTRKVLGDETNAAFILESSVRIISKYLDKRNVPQPENRPDALLTLACHRALYRIAHKEGRLTFVGATNELSQLLRAPDWQREQNANLFLEKLTAELEDQARGMLRFRMFGYDWKEIGEMLRIKPEAARQYFWRSVRKSHLNVLNSGKLERK